MISFFFIIASNTCAYACVRVHNEVNEFMPNERLFSRKLEILPHYVGSRRLKAIASARSLRFFVLVSRVLRELQNRRIAWSHRWRDINHTNGPCETGPWCTPPITIEWAHSEEGNIFSLANSSWMESDFCLVLAEVLTWKQWAYHV